MAEYIGTEHYGFTFTVQEVSCLLPTARCPLPTAHCPANYCVLPTAARYNLLHRYQPKTVPTLTALTPSPTSP